MFFAAEDLDFPLYASTVLAGTATKAVSAAKTEEEIDEVEDLNSSASPREDIYLKGDPEKQKRIFIFFDGTRNEPKSGTNVWRLYDLLKGGTDQIAAIYVEGVGTVVNPLIGAAFGKAMQNRILRGYDFVVQNYNPRDDIFIFGFSRGAFQARALAGFLSYSGVPTQLKGNPNYGQKDWDKILELVKDQKDKEYKTKWKSWTPYQQPLLGETIRKKLKFQVEPVMIEFLGVWDTVPGSSFKSFHECKEKTGFIKKFTAGKLVPSAGERYKTDSYPPIRTIAHAVSVDEKRKKFWPLLVCSADIGKDYSVYDEKNTQVHEEWFPGAHSDVGGGYGSNDLPNISLTWMLRMLNTNYQLAIPFEDEGKAGGLAHWSIADSPLFVTGGCKDRIPGPHAKIHKSINERKILGMVPILVNGTNLSLPYPITCDEMDKKYMKQIVQGSVAAEKPKP